MHHTDDLDLDLDLDHVDDHDRGLRHDLGTLHAQAQHLRGRRAVLGLLGGGAVGGATALVGGALGSSAARAATGTATWAAGGATAAACTAEEIPSETAGPYPGDGSNGPDVLEQTGVVRRDLRSSFGDSAGGTAAGVPLTFVLRLVGTARCRPVAGLAVYAWHCDREGRYSMYSPGVTDENYLRGVQVTNARGKAKFVSVFPGCYSGRWPHVHFEVYRSAEAATSDGTPLVTSQLALPRRPCLQVYRNADGYSRSLTNLERISLGSDTVFGDDRAARQLAAVNGSPREGYLARLDVPVDL